MVWLGVFGCDLARLGSNGCGFWSSLIWLGPVGLVLVSFGLGSSHTVFGLFGFTCDCLGLFESDWVGWVQFGNGNCT